MSLIELLFRKKESKAGIEIPSRLPPLAETEGDIAREPTRGSQPRHTWLWTLITAVIVVALLVYVFVLGFMGVYDGLKDRSAESQRIAQEHYLRGQDYLAAGDYELAIGEFDLALRHDSSLQDARLYLQEAKDLARAQVQPTSETRREAARLLYEQAVDEYEGGNLRQAVAVLEELRGIDRDYQADNVTLMLSRAHQRLGLIAVSEDRLEDGSRHFETVLALQPDDEEAQEQLNLIRLYTAALNYWGRDWPATIQALKGLYALAPDYKDVQLRLHDAYVFGAQAQAEEDQWCQAATQYAAAVEVLPIETTVDQRDEARIRCQSASQPPSPTAPSRATAASPDRVTATPTPTPDTSAGSEATPTAAEAADISGLIAFTSVDATRQQQDIYLVNPGAGDARLLQSAARQPALSANGRFLVFRNLDSGHLGLGILDTRTGDMHDLTAHAEDSAPAWSPDGAEIVFASNKHGDRKWRLYAISPGEVRGEGQEWALGRMPAWSSPGDRIAYHGCDQRGDNCGVWVMKPGGFSPARLTTDTSDTAPAWSPDGSRVAFVSARTGNWEIWLVDIATGQERRVTDHEATDVAPAWSPDGQQIAFLSNRGGTWAIHVLDLESGSVQKLIATGDNYPDPVSEHLVWVP
ncbi:MAG: DPP IV N-terminal domain-containing protein [Anaerolineae bacterium]|jgi:outer membrane protein assembly factor BamD (BamD/ComL family)